MDGITEIQTFLSCVIMIFTPLVWGIKNLFYYFEYRHSQLPEERKRAKKGLISFIIGVVGSMILLLISIIYFKHISVEEEKRLTEQITETPQETQDATSEQASIGSTRLAYRTTRYNGGTYIGYVNKETNSPDGQGKMMYDNGDVYDGEWVNGVRQGIGRMTYANGDIYDGAWLNDMWNGYGEYTWADGRKYYGNYKNDMRDGEGIFSNWDGFVETYGWLGSYYGMSVNDEFEGSGKFEFENGDKFEGIFQKNEFWSGTYTYSDGTPATIIDGEWQ